MRSTFTDPFDALAAAPLRVNPATESKFGNENVCCAFADCVAKAKPQINTSGASERTFIFPAFIAASLRLLQMSRYSSSAGPKLSARAVFEGAGDLRIAPTRALLRRNCPAYVPTLSRRKPS